VYATRDVPDCEVLLSHPAICVVMISDEWDLWGVGRRKHLIIGVVRVLVAVPTGLSTSVRRPTDIVEVLNRSSAVVHGLRHPIRRVLRERDISGQRKRSRHATSASDGLLAGAV